MAEPFACPTCHPAWRPLSGEGKLSISSEFNVCNRSLEPPRVALGYKFEMGSETGLELPRFS
jgi:hypothetical protein